MPEAVVEPCGCIVTRGFGHTHTKVCKQHHAEVFKPPTPPEDNLDLIS